MTEKREIYLYDANTVFKALKEVSGKSWFIVKTVDESIRRIIMSTPPSFLSYGERIEVIVQPEGNDKTLVYVKSEPKVFFNVTAGDAIERNIQKLYQMLDDELRRL
jgi:predicted oxidoreductase (fatty acid repression mutant protein)